MEIKFHESELSSNRLDQYNRRNSIEIQGIPSNVADEVLEDKVANVFKLLNSVNLNIESNVVLFFSKNLTNFNHHLARKCCRLKHPGKIDSSWRSNRVIKLRQTMKEKAIAILPDDQITDLYPDIVFKERQSQNINKV